MEKNSSSIFDFNPTKEELVYIAGYHITEAEYTRRAADVFTLYADIAYLMLKRGDLITMEIWINKLPVTLKQDFYNSITYLI